MKLIINKKLLLLATTSTLTLSGCGLNSELDNTLKYEHFNLLEENNSSSNLFPSYSESINEVEVVDSDYTIYVSEGTFVKANNTVNIREYADVNSKKIDLLGMGTSARYLGEENGFYKIEYLDKIGYVSKDYAYLYDREHIDDEVIKNVYFPKDTLIYDENMESKALIPKNEMAHVYEDLVDTYLVEADGVVGYVDKNSVEDLTGTYSVVDISDQVIRVYEDTEVLLESPVVTGNASTTPTKEGLHTIHSIRHNDKLVSPPNYPFVNVMLKFYKNQGLHDAEYYNDPVYGRHGWRDTSEFGGNTYLTHGSHGCVNMPHDAAIEADSLLEKGDKVLVKR